MACPCLHAFPSPPALDPASCTPPLLHPSYPVPPPCYSSLGFTVGRLSVPGDGPDLRLPSQRQLDEPFGALWAPLPPEPGVFDEAVFKVLPGLVT